jgi:hypothetical protein
LQKVKCVPDVLLRREQEMCEIFITGKIFVLRNTANYFIKNGHPGSKKQMKRKIV